MESGSTPERTAGQARRTKARGRRAQGRWRRGLAAMIAHVILFKPKPGFTPAERQQVLDDLWSAVHRIPSIRRMRLGRRVKHGRPGYEQMMGEDFEYAVLLEFDDLDGLTSYLSHPEHDGIGKHFTQSSAAALAYDYEISDWKPT
jgi:hypothetical protein